MRERGRRRGPGKEGAADVEAGPCCFAGSKKDAASPISAQFVVLAIASTCLAAWEPITSAPQFFSLTESASSRCCIFFTAPWCFRCKQLEKEGKLAGFPADFPQVKFFRVDVEETQDLGELLDIKALPTFSLFSSGAEVHRVEGVPQQRPARRLAQAIRQHLLGEAPPAGGKEEQ